MARSLQSRSATRGRSSNSTHSTTCIVAFGLGYPGRVTQCVLRPNGRIVYEVEYAVDGELRVREFNGDELEVRE